jgi:Meiotically up-regulated gene 113
MQRQVKAERRRHSDTGWIYFVAVWGDPYVKIGLARKSRRDGVKGRIRSMQTGHPKFMYPMHTVQSDDVFRDERIIHGFFEEDRMQGGGIEWFRVPEGTSFPDWLKEHWDWKPWRDGI